MKTRLIELEKDHPVAMEWWKAHGWPGVPVVILPKCGIMVESDEGKPMACAWMYMDNSVGVGMMEWTVTNPTNTPKQSYAAITFLIKAIRELALSFDYGVLLTSVKQEALARIYERNGFKASDEGMKHMVMLTREAA